MLSSYFVLKLKGGKKDCVAFSDAIFVVILLFVLCVVSVFAFASLFVVCTIASAVVFVSVVALCFVSKGVYEGEGMVAVCLGLVASLGVHVSSALDVVRLPETGTLVVVVVC